MNPFSRKKPMSTEASKTPIEKHLTVGNLIMRLTELMDSGVPCDAKVVLICEDYCSETELEIDQFQLSATYPRASIKGGVNPEWTLTMWVSE